MSGHARIVAEDWRQEKIVTADVHGADNHPADAVFIVIPILAGVPVHVPHAGRVFVTDVHYVDHTIAMEHAKIQEEEVPVVVVMKHLIRTSPVLMPNVQLAAIV